MTNKTTAAIDTYQNPEELFLDVAHRVHMDKPIVTGVEDNAFVIASTRGVCTFVGYREQGDTYIVGKMWQKTERVGRREPRIKERDNDYVQCDLYRMDVEDPDDSDETVERIAHDIDDGDVVEELESGYINGYRLTALSDVLEDVFKWY